MGIHQKYGRNDLEYFLSSLTERKNDFRLDEPDAVEFLTGMTKWFQDSGKRAPKPAWNDIVYTYFENDTPAMARDHIRDFKSFLIFTTRNHAERFELIQRDLDYIENKVFLDDYRCKLELCLKPIMLGLLCELIQKSDLDGGEQIIKVNPIRYAPPKDDASYYLPEEVIILPETRHSDPVGFIGDVSMSKGYHGLNMVSRNAPLGFQAVCINPFFKEDYPDKMVLLEIKKRIGRLSYILERTILPPGSLSVFVIHFDCVNFGKAAEKLFKMMTKEYKLRDKYAKIGFLTRNLSVMNSKQEELPANHLFGMDSFDELILMLKKKL